MNSFYIQRILIAQQVLQSDTSMAEEKKCKLTAGSHCDQSVSELQLVYKAILNNFVCEKKYLNVYCLFFFALVCHALVLSSLSLPDYTVVKVSHEV